MANSNGWGDGAANNSIGWGQGANNAIAWGDSHDKSWAGATDIVGLTTDPAASAYFASTGITGATQQTAIDNLVKGLKQDGLWSKMKAVYPFVTDNRNLLSYTEDFSNLAWSRNDVAITVNSTTAPNGTLTADSIIEGTQNNYHGLAFLNAPSINIGSTYTFSCYVKQGSRNWVFLGINDSIDRQAWFNISTGSIGTVNSGITANISDAGNGWYRCSVTRTITNNCIPFIDASTNNSVLTYLGNLSTSLYYWGAQLELGSTATTYQPIATTQQSFISNQFKYNLVNPVDSDAAFRLVFNGGWTHSANGATPNGTNGFANTYLVPSSVLSLNSTHISCYTRTNTSVLAPLLSSEDATTYNNGLFIWPKYSGNLYSVRVNDNSSDSATAVANTQGLHLATRTTSNVKKYRHNTTQIFANTTASTSLNTSTIYVGASRNNANYSTHQTAFASIGDGLTDTEASNLYTRVQAFQNSLNRAVI